MMQKRLEFNLSLSEEDVRVFATGNKRGKEAKTQQW